MIFVVADRESGRRRELTTLLLAAFPGSTVYQHTSLTHASGDALRSGVDAVLVAGEPESDGSSELAHMLQEKKPELPVLHLSDIERIGYGHLPHSTVGQKLRSVLLTAKAEGG